MSDNSNTLALALNPSCYPESKNSVKRFSPLGDFQWRLKTSCDFFGVANARHANISTTLKVLSLPDLTGILFSSCSDVAYSAMRIWQAVGFTAGFVIAEILGFHHRVWVLLATVIVAAIVGMIIEFTTQSKEELLPCIFHKKQHPKPSSDDTQSSGSASDVGAELTRGECNNHRVAQNPMFIVYGGRRPSAMSTWSADSLDSVQPSTVNDSTPPATVVNGGMLLQQNGQNPIFVMYNGRRPSAGSVSSALTHSDACRPSAVVPATISVDREDGRRPLVTSSDSISTPCPPLVITTVPYVGSDLPARVLSPIHESEDDNEGHPAVIKNSSITSIQRSDSYMAALCDM